MENLKELLQEFNEKSTELIEFGDSKEKARGYGIQEVLNSINDLLKK